MNKNLILGGMAGGLVGVTAALLLAPKPGTELMRDVYRPLATTAQKLMPIKTKKTASKKKKTTTTKHASHSSKAKTATKRSAVARKSPAKRRVAKKSAKENSAATA